MVEPPRRQLMLTFDDGPDPVRTVQVLEVLRAARAVATFFFIGRHVERDPEVARSVAAEGHAVGNHTWVHERLTEHGDGEILRSLRRTEAAAADAGVPMSKIVRPPYGDVDQRVRATLERNGYRAMLWTIDPRDWAGASAGAIVDHVAANLHDGAVLLLHDGSPAATGTVAALPAIIDLARAEGFSFVTPAADFTGRSQTP